MCSYVVPSDIWKDEKSLYFNIGKCESRSYDQLESKSDVQNCVLQFVLAFSLKRSYHNKSYICVWSPNTEIITNVTHRIVLHLTPFEYGIGSRVGHINIWVRLMKIPPTCMPRISSLRPNLISHASKGKATYSGVVQEYLYDVVFGSPWAVSRALIYNMKWQVSIPALAVEYFTGQLHRHLLLQLFLWGNCSAF